MKEAIQAFDILRDEKLITDFAIGGAVGAFFYIESSFTEDVDFFVVLPSTVSGLIDINPIYKRLAELGASVQGEYLRVGGKLVQILVPPTALEDEAIRTSEFVNVDGVTTKVFQPEYITAIYVSLLRPKDIGKISELLKLPELDRSKLNDLITRFNLEERWNRYQRLSI